jgi:hypothetical protein
MALFVELVETDSFAARCRSHADGHRNQAKREVAFPDGRGHIDTPSAAALWLCAIVLRLSALRARSKMLPRPVMLILQGQGPAQRQRCDLRGGMG